MEKQLKTELRKLLTGRTMRNEEGWLVAVPEGSYMVYHGVIDRTGYRKIKHREARFKAAPSNEEAFHAVLKALQQVGILVHMESKPTALCALCRFFLTKAVILCVAPEEEGVVLLQAYTGRSVTAGLCCRMAMAKFAKKINLLQEN